MNDSPASECIDSNSSLNFLFQGLFFIAFGFSHSGFKTRIHLIYRASGILGPDDPFGDVRILVMLYVLTRYRKIPIISPGLIFVQKAFLVGLFSGELIFGGAQYYWKEFRVSKWVGLDNKNSLKHYESRRK